MKKEILKISDEETLKISIDTLRDVLNELCCTIDDPELCMKKLMVSRQLDQLIVEYMDLRKSNT